MRERVVYPRVMEVINAYHKGGIDGVRRYYFENPSMIIEKGTWHHRISNDVLNDRVISLKCELNTLSEKIRHNYERHTEGGEAYSDDVTRDEQAL